MKFYPHEFNIWAFGERYKMLTPEELRRCWNARHSSLLYLYGNENISESLAIMYQLYKTNKPQEKKMTKWFIAPDSAIEITDINGVWFGSNDALCFLRGSTNYDIDYFKDKKLSDVEKAVVIDAIVKGTGEVDAYKLWVNIRECRMKEANGFKIASQELKEERDAYSKTQGILTDEQLASYIALNRYHELVIIKENLHMTYMNMFREAASIAIEEVRKNNKKKREACSNSFSNSFFYTPDM